MPYDPFSGSWYDDDRSSSIGTGTYRYNPFDDPVSTQDDLLGALRSSYETPDPVPSSGIALAEPEPPSFFDNLSRLGQSFGSGVAGAAGSLIGAAEGLSRVLPLSGPMGSTVASEAIADELAPTLQQGRYAAENVAGLLRPEREENLFRDLAERPIMGTLERGAEMAPAMASMIGVGGLAGPAAGATAGGLLEFGGAYGQNVDAGVDPERAALTSGARAVAVGLLDRIGLGAILGKTGSAAVEEMAPLLVRAGQAALTQGATEVGQEALGMAEEAINGRVPTWEEAANRLATAGMFGALFGAGATTALGMGGSAAQAPPGAEIPPEAMAPPAAPPVDPSLMAATMAATPQDVPTQQVPMAGDPSTQLLPQMPFDPTSAIPPGMLESPTLPLQEEAVPTQQMTGPLPTEPSLQRTEIAPQEIPVEQYVPDAVRRDIEEARALIAQQKEQARRLGERDPDIAKSPTPRPGRGVLGGPNRAKVAELIPQIVEQDARNRRIEQALDETTDGRAPVETPAPVIQEPAPFPPPRKAPTPKAEPVVETPLEATVDERAPKVAPVAETVPAEALGIQARVGAGLEDALQNVRPVLKKWGTSLGVLTRPARAVIEGAKGQRTASKDTALEVGNAITRLTLREVKAGRWKRAELDSAINAYIDGETPARALPEEIQKAADAARAIVMPLQRRQAAVLRAQKRPELAKTFQSNIGKRHTRAYRAFDDPKHVAKLRKSGDWDRIKHEIQQLPDMKGKSSDEVEAFMQEMTDRDPLSLDLRKGSGLGTAYEGIYKQRQDLPEPIRKLLGEYNTPGELIFRTVDRLQRNVATYEMYSDLKKIGLKEGWLKTQREKDVYKEIPGKSSRNPIGGLYASPEMYEVLALGDPELHSNLIMRALQYTTGAVKANKTVLSIQSQNRNIEGNILLHVANGNFLGARFMPWNTRKGALPIGLRRSFGKLSRTTSGRGTVKDILRAKKEGRLETFDPLARRAEIEEAVKYGIFDQAPDVKDIEFFFGADGPLDPKRSFGAKSLEEIKRYAQHLYRLGDGGYKHDAWKQEQNRLAWYHEGEKGWTPDRIKAVAADRVKDTYPTSDRQPKWVQEVRRQPIIGGFISFYLDIPRVVKNIAKLGVEEVVDGRKTGNKRMVISGTQRLASLGAGVVAMEAASAALKAARSALSKDEDKPKRDEELMFRPFLPEYLHNARTPVLTRGKGWAVISDVSFMDPWAMLKKPVMAAIRSMAYDEKGFDRAVWEGFKELVGPVAQEGLVVGPYFEARRGIDSNGNRIWYENEDPGPKLWKSLAYVAKRWEPGTATTMKRIGGALQSGDLKKFATEAAAVVGPRFMMIDMDDQLPRLAGRYSQYQREATSVFNRTLRPIASEDDRKREFLSAVEMYKATAKDLVAGIRTARELNLSEEEIERLLGNSSISQSTIQLAFEGEAALVKAYRKKLRDNYDKFHKNPTGWRDD